MDSIAEQFTGLKDNTGEDIYEGDIVQLDPDDDPCQIFFAEGKFQAEDNNVVYDLSEEYMDCEIVGNIHENPELVG